MLHHSSNAEQSKVEQNKRTPDLSEVIWQTNLRVQV